VGKKPVDTRVDDFLKNAADCERKAEEARDPLVKRTYRDLAAQWRHLAGQVDMLQY